MEIGIFERPCLRVNLACWRYTNVKGDEKTYVGLGDDGVQVSGDWGEGVNKEALSEDLYKAIKTIIEKHCKKGGAT